MLYGLELSFNAYVGCSFSVLISLLGSLLDYYDFNW